MQKRHSKRTAKRFFKKLLKGLRYAPRVIITDKLRSYGAARKEILPGVEHRQHKGLNNQAEVSHQPTRQQERQMRGFKLRRVKRNAFSGSCAHQQPIPATPSPDDCRRLSRRSAAGF